jgi:hypothetical protein
MMSFAGSKIPKRGLTNISKGENKKDKFNKCQKPRMI